MTRSDVLPAVSSASAPDRREAAGASAVFPRLPEVRRADPALMVYYAISSLALGPFFLFALVPAYFKYHSLRYTVEEDGISMRWGVLFRREVSLNYARIQDIHLSSNVVERWLGLAKIQVQTASGSSSAEMTIEGLKDFEGVRDFLYGRMRGARDRLHASASGEQAAMDSVQLLANTLSEIAAELRQIRRSLPSGSSQESEDA
ncbi:MAG TPA: PH domain-containing protein [Longimicrobiaceae bacterium]